MCGKNNDVAFGRLLLGPRDGAWTEISDKISQCLRTSGVGYNYGVTSGYQMAAERACYVTGTIKPIFMTNLLLLISPFSLALQFVRFVCIVIWRGSLFVSL